MTEALPGGRPVAAGFALQEAADYLEAAEIILTAIGAGRNVAGIGVDFTASSPMPAFADGRGGAKFGEPAVIIYRHRHSVGPELQRLQAVREEFDG
jgi:L-ribulokinase